MAWSGGHMFYKGLNKVNIKKGSSLNQQGQEHYYRYNVGSHSVTLSIVL